MTELQNAINSIRNIAPKLNQATDAAKQAVARVEKFLNEECTLGLPVQLQVHTDNEEDQGEVVRTCTFLAYCHVDSKFRVAVIRERMRWCQGDNPDLPGKVVLYETIPWAEATGELKALTFRSLPDLLKQIEKEACRAAADTEGTVEMAEKVLAAVDGGGAAKPADAEKASREKDRIYQEQVEQCRQEGKEYQEEQLRVEAARTHDKRRSGGQ